MNLCSVGKMPSGQASKPVDVKFSLELGRSALLLREVNGDERFSLSCNFRDFPRKTNDCIRSSTSHTLHIKNRYQHFKNLKKDSKISSLE